MIKRNYKTKYIDGQECLLHRIIMEKHLGRKLTNEEVVHHIDGNIHNNTIENLKLFSNKAAHTQHHKLGISFTEEHKRKIGEANKGKKRTPEMCIAIGQRMKGRKHTDEECTRMSKAQWFKPNHAKLTVEDVRDIRKMLKNKIRHFVIAFAFGVKTHAIKNISRGKTWRHV